MRQLAKFVLVGHVIAVDLLALGVEIVELIQQCLHPSFVGGILGVLSDVAGNDEPSLRPVG